MFDARFARSERKRLLLAFCRRFSASSWGPLLAAVATISVAPAVLAADHEVSRATATTLSLELGGAVLLTGAALALPTGGLPLVRTPELR